VCPASRGDRHRSRGQRPPRRPSRSWRMRHPRPCGCVRQGPGRGIGQLLPWVSMPGGAAPELAAAGPVAPRLAVGRQLAVDQIGVTWAPRWDLSRPRGRSRAGDGEGLGVGPGGLGRGLDGLRGVAAGTRSRPRRSACSRGGRGRRWERAGVHRDQGRRADPHSKQRQAESSSRRSRIGSSKRPSTGGPSHAPTRSSVG
jgi:hypothetical protein